MPPTSAQRINARHQFVLDLSREDVLDYCKAAVAAVPERTDIRYVKWDFNRAITDAWSAAPPAEQGGATSVPRPTTPQGAILPLHTRGFCAMMGGKFGYELDVSLLTDAKKGEVRGQIADYKAIERLVHGGDYYRLADPSVCNCGAWMFVSADKTECTVTYACDQTDGVVLILHKHRAVELFCRQYFILLAIRVR